MESDINLSSTVPILDKRKTTKSRLYYKHNLGLKLEKL